MTYRVLPHGRLEFTLEDGSVWLFRKADIRHLAFVMPIPGPEGIAGESATDGPKVNENKPAFIQRAEITEKASGFAQLLFATSIKPKLVENTEEIQDGEPKAYLCELGSEAVAVAGAILKEGGFSDEEQKIGPFPGNGERAGG